MDYESATDTQLLHACRRGDDRAARQLHARLSPIMLALARSTLRDHHLAEDAVQRAFCQIMKQPRRGIARIENAKAWLMRVVRNEAVSQARMLMRSRERERLLAEQAAAQFAGMGAKPGQAAADTPLGQPASLAEISQAVESLTDELREIVYLKHVAGLTFDQIEAATGINRNTAASRHRVAMGRLSEALKRLKANDAPLGGVVSAAAKSEANHVR